tara:strand:- start:450 stop:1628 length:1179 start_codon:yes stop_codon:yes gene_type:complete
MKIALLDSTIREGEQSPNVSFSIEQKIEIVRELDSFGIEFIELGHPVVSPDIREAVRQISRINTNAQKIIHGRATKSDIDDAISFNVPWIGIFFGTSDLSLKYKFGINRSEAIKRIVDAVSYAKEKGIKLRFTAEDASRTERSYLVEVAQKVEEAGADRFSIADTVGILTPEKTSSIVSNLKKSISIPIHIHCHNDFGLATANVASALNAGAQVADVTVNGLGERTGIAPLAEVAVLLKQQYNVDNNWELGTLTKISRKVEKMSGVFNSTYKPIVGLNAFTHKSGLHTSAVLKEPKTYEPFAPELIQRNREISIDKYSGKESIANYLDKIDIAYTNDQLRQILEEIKSNPKKGRYSRIELLKIVEEISRNNEKFYKDGKPDKAIAISSSEYS